MSIPNSRQEFEMFGDSRQLEQDYLQRIGKVATSLRGCEPDFMIISASKTGTTWVGQNLNLHPGIFIPEIKELHYFNKFWKWLDINWYLEHFRDYAHRKKGEATPYAALPLYVIRIIAQTFPRLKLIFLIRDPIQRAWSHTKHDFQYRRGVFHNYVGDFAGIPERKFVEQFTHSDTINIGDQHLCLDRWLSCFDRRRIFVGFFESIGTEPHQLLRGIFDHLGVNSDIDLAAFPAFRKIHPGIEEDIPPSLQTCLDAIYIDKTKRLSAFLKERFALETPVGWAGMLAADSPRPVVVEGDYQGLALLLHQGKFYALPEARRARCLANADELEECCARRECYAGHSLDEVKYYVDHQIRDSERERYTVKCHLADSGTDFSSPVTFIEHYLGYDVFIYRRQFYILKNDTADTGLQQLDEAAMRERKNREECMVAPNLQDAHRQIEEYLPILTFENYHGYNIVLFRRRYYALAMTQGHIDLRQLDTQRLHQLEVSGHAAVADTLEEAKTRVSQFTDHQSAMTDHVRPLISLIVPTRARVEKLRQFLDSLAATTAKPDRVEVILVADQDDPQTLAFRHSAMPFKMVTVPAGQTMGALNRAGYAASRGDFIMLLNDDVIVRTHAWDEKLLEVFRTYPDGMVLVHVNDLIFQEKLCTFPFLTRAYCEIAGGICPHDYARYRIDDHIYNVFNLLALLGKKRIVYLPQIVFEHTNTGAGAGTDRYVPIPEIHAADTQHFDRLLSSRKELAIKLAETIDRHLSSQLADTRRKLLAPVEDSVALRRPEFVTVRQAHSSPSSKNTRVTIGVVSADLRNEHAKTCIDAIKQHTANYDLVVLDNNFGPGFNHSREMNRIRAICRTDFLVLMDDDVFVEPGWLDGLLRCVTPQTGVVTPMHMNGDGALAYAGVVMSPERSGHHTHSFRVPERPEPIQTLCSAVMLIDMTKCGHICIDESYSKYFLDIDYGLRIWESGYQVVLSPYCMVTHVGGATLQQGSKASNELFEIQRTHFVREWIASERYRKLETDVWRNVPEISKLLKLPGEMEHALRTCFDDLNAVGFREKVRQLLEDVELVPTLRQWVNNYLADFLQRRRATIGSSVRAEFEWLKQSYVDCLAKGSAVHSFHSPELLETCGKYNLVRYRGKFWAIPLALGHFDLRQESSRTHPELLTSDKLSSLRELALGVTPSGIQARRSSKTTGRVPSLFGILRSERARLGGWWPAVKFIAKRAIRWIIISAFGHEAFQNWKVRWRRIRSRT